MRQANGLEVFGVDDPRCQQVGILHIASTDDRKSVLQAILMQQKLGRTSIVLDLPAQGKALTRAVDFDDLKAVQRKLAVELVMVLSPGSLADLARQRAFAVYATLQEYAQAVGAARPAGSPSPEVAPGVLGTIGTYRLLAELGEGAYGRVYKAQHIYLTNRIVALKQLYGEAGRSVQDRQRFVDQVLHEARILEALQHAAILPLRDCNVVDGIPFLVTEFAPHGSLRDRLLRRPGSPLPLKEALPLLLQIGQGLDYAHHQQVVHRDLKPENLLFRTPDDIVIADFGIAVLLQAARTTHAEISGTLAYMAPEQFSGLVSTKSDQYALGCIAYELLTGCQPFRVADPTLESMWYKHANVAPMAPTRLNPSLPAAVDHVLLKALAKQREGHYATVTAFIAALFSAML